MDERINSLIDRLRIKVKGVRVQENPNTPWFQGDHWKCRLYTGHHQMTLYFSQGYKYNGECPTVARIIECLVLDSSGFENSSNFFDWCANYGFDADKKSTKEMYNKCVKHAQAFKRLIGEDEYQAVII